MPTERPPQSKPPTALSNLCLQVLSEFRGPVPYHMFARRVAERLLHRPVDARENAVFMEWLKQAIIETKPPGIAMLSPSSDPGIGYVFDAHDPSSQPISQPGV
jgi:hypothetical protein